LTENSKKLPNLQNPKRESLISTSSSCDSTSSISSEPSKTDTNIIYIENIYQTTLCMADLISLMYNNLVYWNILIVTVVMVVVVIWNHLFCFPNHGWGCMGNLNNFYFTATDHVNVKKRRRYQVIRKDRSQSISSILELLNGCQLRQSNIAQKSGLTYKQVKKYVTLLTKCNLVNYNERELTYKTTTKGLHYLTLQYRMIELLPLTSTKSDQWTDD
jgi:predicted transcriptional regulator